MLVSMFDIINYINLINTLYAISIFVAGLALVFFIIGHLSKDKQIEKIATNVILVSAVSAGICMVTNEGLKLYVRYYLEKMEDSSEPIIPIKENSDKEEKKINAMKSMIKIKVMGRKGDISNSYMRYNSNFVFSITNNTNKDIAGFKGNLIVRYGAFNESITLNIDESSISLPKNQTVMYTGGSDSLTYYYSDKKVKDVEFLPLKIGFSDGLIEEIKQSRDEEVDSMVSDIYMHKEIKASDEKLAEYRYY